MGLGEIPIASGTLRAYYRLSDATDTTSLGFNLTNNNSVAFVNTGKFASAADFGTTGTNKGLTYGSSIFNAASPDLVYFSFWYKLNSTADVTGKFFFNITSNTAATTGRQYSCQYTITSNFITIDATRRIVGPSLINVTVGFTADTNWHNVQIFYDSTNSIFEIRVDEKYWNTSTSTSTGASLLINPTVYAAIGNTRSLNQQVYAQMDEFIVSEDTNLASSTSKGYRRRYYTQAKGYFV